MTSANPNNPSLRIGIADDDRAQRRLITAAIERMGHEIVCAAADGEEFLALVADLPLDLAILDLDMPKIDGLAVAEELALTRRVPIILVSGHGDAEHVQLGTEPVQVCLQKPVSFAELQAAILSSLPTRNTADAGR